MLGFPESIVAGRVQYMSLGRSFCRGVSHLGFEGIVGSCGAWRGYASVVPDVAFSLEGI